jgi:hypothetical protein
MAALNTHNASYVTGAGPTFVNAATADDCEAPTRAGQMYVHYKNTTATPRTVAVVVPGTTGYDANMPAPGTSGTYTLAATTGELIIPLHPAYANSSGRVGLTVNSVAAGVTVAVVKLPTG